MELNDFTERIATAWLFVMGLSLGSFLNVVIYRLPRGQSLVSPRSRCPKCGHQLAWFENVPVVSWVVLTGKCRMCRAPISPRYVTIELLTGVLFLACLARFGWTWQLLSAVTLIFFLIPLTFIDAEFWILPFELTVPGIVAGVALNIPLGADAVWASARAAAVCFVVYRALEWFGWLAFRKEALGAGDKFLLALVGAFLGLGPFLGIIFLSSMQGAAYGIANLLLRGKAGPDAPPPVDDTTPAAAPVVPVAEAPVAPATSAAVGTPAGATAPVASTTESPVGPPMPTVETPADSAAPGPVEAGAPEAQPRPPAGPAEEPPLTFTPACFAPGLPVWKRVALIPWTLLLQPIPDEPPPDETTGEVPDWVPQQTALPFGPWIALAALEVMLLGPRVVSWAEYTPLWATAKLMFE